MTPEQMSQLLDLAERLADRQFTIAQASDWPILVVAAGIGASMVGFMWRDLGKKFDQYAGTLKEHKEDNLREHDKIWKAIRDCQDDCCTSKPKKEKP